MSIKWATVRDSYNMGHLTGVARVGCVYMVASNLTQHMSGPEREAIKRMHNWSDGHKPVAQKRLRQLFAQYGQLCETRPSLTRRGQYDLCVYPSAYGESARRACLAAQSGMSDTNADIAQQLEWL